MSALPSEDAPVGFTNVPAANRDTVLKAAQINRSLSTLRLLSMRSPCFEIMELEYRINWVDYLTYI